MNCTAGGVWSMSGGVNVYRLAWLGLAKDLACANLALTNILKTCYLIYFPHMKVGESLE